MKQEGVEDPTIVASIVPATKAAKRFELPFAIPTARSQNETEKASFPLLG
jgi:hypothetical protein